MWIMNARDQDEREIETGRAPKPKVIRWDKAKKGVASLTHHHQTVSPPTIHFFDFPLPKLARLLVELQRRNVNTTKTRHKCPM